MMNATATIADLLARSERSFARMQHRNRAGKLCWLAATGLLYALILGEGVAQLLAVWAGGDWFRYWEVAISAPTAGLIVVQVALWTDSRAPLFAPVARLREALREGDASLAPLGDAVRSSSWTAQLPPGGRIGPLRPLRQAETILWLVIFAAILLLLVVIGVPTALASGLPQAAAILAAICLPPTVPLLLLAWRYTRPFHVRVDEQGLRWRTPAGLPRRLPWHEAHSFFTVTYLRIPFPPRLLTLGNETVYGLEAENTALAWRADPPAGALGEQPSPSVTLLQLAAERTGLPLRDVSREAQRIAQATNQIQVTMTNGKLRAMPLPRVVVAHRFRLAGIVLAPFLLLVVVSLVAMLAQTPYYEHLYAQSHSHHALYADPLTHADGDWPTTPFASFSGGAYHFAESETAEDVMYVAAPHQANDALYEVTAEIQPGSDVQGIGLGVAWEGVSFPDLTFTVDTTAGWVVSYWPPGAPSADQYFNSGSSGDIHKGFDTANQIAVLVRGTDYSFFVNGHYVGGYQNDKLAGGRVGLYLDSISNPGDFNDFAVYSLS